MRLHQVEDANTGLVLRGGLLRRGYLDRILSFVFTPNIKVRMGATEWKADVIEEEGFGECVKLTK